MKSLLIIPAALLLTLPGFAQRNGFTPVGTGGFGNVLHPGTGGPSAAFPTRLGTTVSGYYPSNSYPNTYYPNGYYSNGQKGGARRSTGSANAYPLYVGGAYVPPYAPGYAPDYSSQTQLNPQQQYAPPPVIINQYFPPPPPQEPVTTFYQPSGDRPQQAEDESAPAQNKYYLLAFKDHSVYSALAYWVEDKTLHYVTTQNTHNQASLDLVDLEFTKQLNQDRAVPFSLTPSK